MKIAVIVLALLVALGRMFITPRLTPPTPFTAELSYEAFAHIVWGGLLFRWFTLWHVVADDEILALRDKEFTVAAEAGLCGWLALFLALWELGWFLCQKYL